MYTEGSHVYHVYIITNKSKSVLYTGMTNYLARRLLEHSENIKVKKKTFATKYKCRHLRYYEKFTWVHEAIAREKNQRVEQNQKIEPHLNRQSIYEFLGVSFSLSKPE